jgi:glycosyltransferase involved in cell wall biosynthesis
MTTSGELRVLMLGPLGPPHVENQALALTHRGVHVHVGGNAPAELDDTVLEDAGVAVSRSPGAARNTPWGIAATTRWARQLIAEVQPDVVHAHWLPGFGFASALAGASPLAVTAWGSDVYQAGRAMAMANRVAVRRAQMVMADSQDLLDRCVELGAKAGRTALIQWGVDLVAFSPAADRAEVKAKLGLGPGPVILSPRSIMPVYNIPTIVEAFERVGAEFEDAQLVLKHMGAASVELPAIPHPDRVQVIGKVPYEVMADYYRAADVCVSITSSDSSPRSVWEAMACGAPCVLSDLPWVRELIEPGRDALTVPVSAPAVVDAIVRVISDPELATELSRNGRALVDTHLNQAREMDRLVEVYRSLADDGGAS